jgi:hypothetical protein
MISSPTGYYAKITTTRLLTGGPEDVIDWSVENQYPVVSFQNGESMIVNPRGELRQAKEYTAEIREGYTGDTTEGVRFEVELDVTPYPTPEA